MAFYQFLAIFPSVVAFLAISARVPDVGAHLRDALQDLSQEALPNQAAQLFLGTIDGLYSRAYSGWQLVSVCTAAVWAALNGTWAMIYGLNRAYEVRDRRSWWGLAITIVGLAVGGALTICIALFLVFFGAELQAHFHRGDVTYRTIEWLVLVVSVSLWFALLYRFGPNVRDHEWRWSTPGALCALVLWIGATFGARIYFGHVNNYSTTYGRLNGVVILLMWLYVTNGAILIGGEMNSEIEKSAEQRRKPVSADISPHRDR